MDRSKTPMSWYQMVILAQELYNEIKELDEDGDYRDVWLWKKKDLPIVKCTEHPDWVEWEAALVILDNFLWDLREEEWQPTVD